MTERFSSTALGFVCIVGAGPGPLDLMTLRALNRLSNADVLVHDRLAGTEVLDQIPPKAQRVYVGNGAWLTTHWSNRVFTPCRLKASLLRRCRV